MYPMSEYRNSSKFADWLGRYNRRNHADLTTKTAPEYLLVEFVEMGVNGMEVERLTAENAKLREQLADYENREGACCPEDVGFDEHIKILREQLAEAQRIIAYIDKKFPRADKTCDEPGITFSEAVRRTLADMDTNNAD